MKGWFTQNLTTKFGSLCLAILFWFFVLSSQNTFFIFPEEVTLQAFNVPEGLAVVSDLGGVTVTVQADAEEAKTLTVDDFSAYVDLSGLAEGDKKVEVVVNVNDPEIGIVSWSPERVEVSLEALTTQTLEIDYQVTGEPAKHYEATVPDQELESVEVQGGTTAIQSIDHIQAEVVLNGSETESFVKTVTLIAVDEAGVPVPNIVFEEDEVSVEVVVERIQTQKTVGVKVNLASPENGWIESISVVPAVVRIEGELEVLESIEHLETESFAVTSSAPTFEIQVELVLPEGVALSEGESDTVEVTVVLGQSTVSDESDPSD